MEKWVDIYLKRLGVDLQQPSLDYLKELHNAHMLQVPFENTSIMAKPTRNEQSISLDVVSLVHKMVNSSHGGYCYELNGLFSELLRQLGFNVHNFAALMMGDEDYHPDSGIIDHMTLAVDLPEGRYYTDVGGGNSVRCPLKLGEEISDISGRYRIVELETPVEARGLDTTYTLALQKYHEDWKHVFIFSEKDFKLSDYIYSSYWMETTTKSHFTERLVVSKATKTGRITISGNQLKITENENPITQELSKEQLSEVLKTKFGIEDVIPPFSRDIDWNPS